jgi:glutamate carboxypeptidase
LTAAEPILAELQGELEEMVAETERLVRIDSGTGDIDGIQRVGEAIGELLTPLGFTLERRPGGGLQATLTLGPGPKLLILGHLDTVWPAGTAAAWHPERRDGMLSGPGAGDMKSSLVMAVHAIGAARRAGIDGLGEVELLLVPDEEHGSVASRDWIEERARDAQACLGLEAGWPGGGVVVARGAVGAVTLVARGRTAHCAGHEDRGASAIAALAPLVAPLEALSRPQDGVLVNVGRFTGGVARQVVPDLAELELDLRAPDRAAADALLDQVGALIAESRVAPVAVELHGGITRPGFTRAVSTPVWELARARATELGFEVVAESSRGGADASFAAALGVPTLDGLGPICHDSCARGERIEIASLAQRAALMACLIIDLAGCV